MATTFAKALQTLRMFADAKPIIEVLALGERFGRVPNLEQATEALDFLCRMRHMYVSMGIDDEKVNDAVDYFSKRIEYLHSCAPDIPY